MPYYVIPHQFAAHPIYQDILAANPHLNFDSRAPPGTGQHKKDLHAHLRTQQPLAMPTSQDNADPAPQTHKFVVPPSLAKFERSVEKQYMNVLHQYCRSQIESRNDQLQRAKGLFGIGADWDKVQQLTEMRLDKCDELSRMGYRVSY